MSPGAAASARSSVSSSASRQCPVAPSAPPPLEPAVADPALSAGPAAPGSQQPLATGSRDLRKSEDAIFSFVALGLSQQVFPRKLRQIFSDRQIGLSLLKKSNFAYVFTVEDRFVDCPVFLHRRTHAREPETDSPHNCNSPHHPSDTIVRGQHHRQMHGGRDGVRGFKCWCARCRCGC